MPSSNPATCSWQKCLQLSAAAAHEAALPATAEQRAALALCGVMCVQHSKRWTALFCRQRRPMLHLQVGSTGYCMGGGLTIGASAEGVLDCG